ncbi:exonuclease sbcCD subunit D [Pseudoalteromonas phenolica]|uniref:Nuclease SbcCD subunit D n=1 Tax=Pseudoalteromonas phenolica TaxID=161398 RepID=A0A5R9Q4Q9_9GAMM|nr:exonuclease subunit SbcD [Pseudoalteromonas phenolica]TLX48148.1 exonuclease sbcCD subunit D [Pseudoalteromonas phenolica]
MKVLHTSDWHLGQQFYEHHRVQEHQYFLDWLVTTLQQQAIDLLLVAGDIYHTATPPSSAEQQLYQFIKQVKQACPELHIVIIAGNHDSANRIETAKPLLKQFDTHVIGRYDKADPATCLVNIETEKGKAQVVAMPFLRPADVTLDTQNNKAYQQGVAQAYQSVVELCEESTAPIIVMGHLHAKGGTISEDSERNISIGGFDAVTAEVFTDKADYVALGHLHKAQVVAKCDAKRYCGTPMPMSFSEKNYQHQVLVCEFNGKTCESVNPLYTPRLRQLIVLPKKGGADLAVLCNEIEKLDLSSHEASPYLRLRLNASETDSQFREKISSSLKDKDILFCGIERVQDVQKHEDEVIFQDLGQVEKLNPLDLLDMVFKQQVDSEQDLPANLADCLAEVLNDMEEEQNA